MHFLLFKASEIDPTNKWFFIGMYDVNYATSDYQGIKTVDKLIKFDPKFKEDLTSLYMNTGQFDAALELINELNETVGKSDRRILQTTDLIARQIPKYGDRQSNSTNQ
jgi:hypothetical protein